MLKIFPKYMILQKELETYTAKFNNDVLNSMAKEANGGINKLN